MVSKTNCAAILGIGAEIISIEVDIGDGLPSCDMVGLLSSEVREARERVRTALRNSGIFLPSGRMTISLSPADIRKEGAGFDLGIAMGIVISLGIVLNQEVKDFIFIGELGLDGRICKVNGVLNMILKAREEGFKVCVVPKENVSEATMVDGVKILAVDTLSDLITVFQEKKFQYEQSVDVRSLIEKAADFENEYDFRNVYGQEVTKRAIEIAVSGMHNLLLMGAPGCGKSLMAKSIPSIMPIPDVAECMEITGIHSISGKLRDNEIVLKRPFISPHYTSTLSSFTGGGRVPRPGDISLAHGGILYLDEFPEFPRHHLEALRQPMEDGRIAVSRVNGNYIFPAAFMLVASMNPCPCGYYPDRSKCNCSESDIKRYRAKLSGPMLDRIDICVTVDNVKLSDLEAGRNRKGHNENSADMRTRIERARLIQKERFKDEDIFFNSRMNNEKISRYCQMTNEAENYLKFVFAKKNLSARSYHKIIKVAQTICDLDGKKIIDEGAIAEAVGLNIYE